jgi:hypothetical protein
MLRIPHFLDICLTEGDEVSLKHLPRYTPFSDTHLCWWLSKPQGLVPAEELDTLIKFYERRVALVRAGVSEECGASINRVTRISELGTT